MRTASCSTSDLVARSAPMADFSASQRCFMAPGLLGDVRELLLEGVEARLRRLVALLAQRLALDLQLDPAALQLVELDRHGVDLHPQPARRLVHQVDRLVGQEALGDVAVGQRGRGDQRGVRDPDAVVDLVALAQAAQDRDRLLDRRLVHHHRLEAPLERRVLLDVLAVLVERGRADRVELAAGQHRLEQVGRVHRALGGARRPTTVWSSSMNRITRPSLSLISLRTALSRSSNSPRNLEPAMSAPRSSVMTRLSLSVSGTSPRTIRWARPSAMAVLPTPGSPMRTGLFLVRRLRTWMTRRISSSRPMTGSSLPARASAVRSRPYFSSAW